MQTFETHPHPQESGDSDTVPNRAAELSTTRTPFPDIEEAHPQLSFEALNFGQDQAAQRLESSLTLIPQLQLEQRLHGVVTQSLTTIVEVLHMPLFRDGVENLTQSEIIKVLQELVANSPAAADRVGALLELYAQKTGQKLTVEEYITWSFNQKSNNAFHMLRIALRFAYPDLSQNMLRSNNITPLYTYLDAMKTMVLNPQALGIPLTPELVSKITAFNNYSFSADEFEFLSPEAADYFQPDFAATSYGEMTVASRELFVQKCITWANLLADVIEAYPHSEQTN